MAPPIDPMRRHAEGCHSNHAAFDAGGDYFVSVGYSQVPERSPYKAGEWIVCHGYPGELPGPLQWGWRGYVLGGMGSTILRGVTDDGREWAEYWGRLKPDGTPCPDGRCVCHPRSSRWWAPRKALVEQLDLFGGAL